MWVAIFLLAMIAGGIVFGEIGSNRRHSELLIDGARRDAAALAYQTQQADANASIRVLEEKVGRFRRDMWQDKWPDVDERLLTRLQEMTDEIADSNEAGPQPRR